MAIPAWKPSLTFDEKFRSAFGGLDLRPKDKVMMQNGVDLPYVLWFEHPGFSEYPAVRWPERLEMERRGLLHEGHARVPQHFLGAMNRSLELFRAAFADTRSVGALLEFASDGRVTRGDHHLYKALRACGFVSPASVERHCMRLRHATDSESGDGRDLDWDGWGFRHMCRYALDLSPDDPNVSALLWTVNAAETGITPSCGPFGLREAFFVDFERRILFHPYDDRGLRISALDREPLLPLYGRCRGWLNRHHLDDMARKFAAPGAAG